MPANGFSVGRDLSLTVFTSEGVIGTAGLTAFEARQLTSEIRQPLISGDVLAAYLPEGWQGVAEFTRLDDGLDDWFAAAESAYLAGQAPATAEITETITNPDGTVSQFVYRNVALRLESPGAWAGGKEVRQRVNWIASRRMAVG